MQYGIFVRAELNAWQRALPSVTACRCNCRWPERPRYDRGAAGRRQKGRKKFRKPPFLTRPIALPRHDRGVGASHGASKGNEDGGISCCGSGPEPVTGFVGVCSVLLLLLFSPCRAIPTTAAPYADIVVDANSGNVLHATNPDALRHPASLTKIMTLYLLFEQLEAGKLKLDSQLKVSERGRRSSRRPSSACKPGQHDLRSRTPSRAWSRGRPTTPPSSSPKRSPATRTNSPS